MHKDILLHFTTTNQTLKNILNKEHKIVIKLIYRCLKIEINEDEVANIALHIGGAVERASYNSKDKVFKTIIVCTSGIGTLITELL